MSMANRLFKYVILYVYTLIPLKITFMPVIFYVLASEMENLHNEQQN